VEDTEEDERRHVRDATFIPPGWHRHLNEEGVPYYQNPEGTTQWNKPPEDHPPSGNGPLAGRERGERQRDADTNKKKRASSSRGMNAGGFSVMISLLIITSSLFQSAWAAPCTFSDDTFGSFTVPSLGCTLTKMITVNGAMNVSGVAGNSPLRELAAMGGTPTYALPKRHFHITTGNSLFLSYLKLMGGRVYSVYQDIAGWYTGGTLFGGSIMVEGSNAVLEVHASLFVGNGEVSAERGGAIVAREKAQATIVDSSFESFAAAKGCGAIWVETKATINIVSSQFIKNKALVQHGGAMCVQNNASVAITDSTFESNTAKGYGGGMAIFLALQVHVLGGDSNGRKLNTKCSSAWICSISTG
jgi:hypothetical protein